LTWIKLDDNAPDHPKVASLSDRAFRWWIKGLAYASRFLTDGLLPPIFWKQVPKGDRAELATQKLWDWLDPNFLIHDYLLHQSRKEDVEADKERTRQNAKAYRDRRKEERRKADDANRIVIDDASSDRHHPVIAPENRDQIQRSEIRGTTPPASHRGGGLIVTGVQFQKLQETHAFVGSKLRVPKVLHAELISKSGADADAILRRWYQDLDDKLEESGQGTGDVFAWLRPRHQAFAISKGWIDAPPKPSTPERKPFSVAEAMARKEAQR
jgi:hypothetical protein